MLRAIAIILGVVLAAAGGVIAYRALFLEPAAAVVVSSSSGDVREVPNYLRIIGGSVLFLIGAAMAFLLATRKRV